MWNIISLLTTLITLIFETTLKMFSSLTTLTTLIFKTLWKILITDYAEYPILHVTIVFFRKFSVVLHVYMIFSQSNHNTISLRVFVHLSFNLYRSCCFTIEFYLGSFFFILMSFLIFFLMLVLHYFSANSASGLSGANLFPFFLQGRNQKLFKAGEVP